MINLKLSMLMATVLIWHAGNAYAFTAPQAVRSGYKSIKVVLSGARTTSTSQLDWIKGINAGRIVYQAPRTGDSSTKIRHLLSLAQARGDVSMAEMTQLGMAYRVLGDAGPNALARCLNAPQCDHVHFITNQQRSSLHRSMSWQMPHLTPSGINHKVGELNERVMRDYYTSSGWRELPGEVGRNGIDGLFVKYRQDGSVRDVLVSESKYNFSPMGNTLHGRQMSQQWTQRKIEDVYRATGDPRYLEIQRLVEQGNYRSILWRLKPAADNSGIYMIQRQRVTENAGVLTFDEIRGGHRMLVDRVANQTIDVTHPANAFQANMARNIQRAFDDIVAEEYARMAR